MSNPFEDLRKRQLAEKEKHRPIDEAKQLIYRRFEIYSKHKYEIRDVMQNLRSAIYRFPDVSEFNPDWWTSFNNGNGKETYIYDNLPLICIIGRYRDNAEYFLNQMIYTFDNYAQLIDYLIPLVTVTLVLKEQEFILQCKTLEYQAEDGSQYKECSLSKPELIKTLLELHEKPYVADASS